MNITYIHQRGRDLVGLIPQFLVESDPRPAAEQFNDRYAFGGGWRPMEGWTHVSVVRAEQELLLIKYPGDPAYEPVARIEFHEETVWETVWVYPHAWVAIERADGSVEISRMD